MTLLFCRTWKSSPKEAGAAVEDALKAGYRHIDCAQIYDNEKEIGEVLQKCFKEGVVKREDVFITSKLGYLTNYVRTRICSNKNMFIELILHASLPSSSEVWSVDRLLQSLPVPYIREVGEGTITYNWKCLFFKT